MLKAWHCTHRDIPALRVDADIRDNAGVPQHWLGGGSPQLSQEAFYTKWGAFVSTADGAVTCDISSDSLAAAAASPPF